MSNKSAEAFLHQIESGKRTTAAHFLYSFINVHENKKRTQLRDLRYNLNYSHQTLTARLSELCDMGVIYEDDNGYFHITPHDKIAQYAAMREDARYKKWKKLGEKSGWLNQLRIV